jgi:hypothetical protein
MGGCFQSCGISNPIFLLALRNLSSKSQDKDRMQWLPVTFSGSGLEDVYRKDSFLPFDLECVQTKHGTSVQKS